MPKSDEILITARKHEFPPELEQKFQKIKKLEWITVAYLISVVVVMYFAMGSSQAMKVAWLEDLLSIVPAVSFLIAARIFQKSPDKNFPYGYHRVFSIAFLMGSFALLGMGIFTAYDSLLALIKAEHPTIGSIKLFGKNIWMGWVMIAALLYSFIPAMILGRMKLPYAKKLHMKILYTDAQAQKADWLTAVAAIAGIIGIGFGLWWADAVAALIIALDIMKEGFTQTKGAITDLMDETPKKVTDNSKNDRLVEKLAHFINEQDWVKEARVRLREEGNVYFGEVYVLPVNEENLIKKIEETEEKAKKLHWKIFDLSFVPVATFDKE
jgi:cation diffusion facilitator family transporter